MINRRRIISSVLILTVFSTFQLTAQLLDKTLATVRLTETEVVSQSEMDDQFAMLEQQFQGNLNAQQKEEIFQSRINSILINQAADREGLTVSDNELSNAVQMQKSSMGVQVDDARFRQMVEQQTGMSWDEYTAQLERRIIQEKYIGAAKPQLLQNLAAPTDQEINSVYEENAQSFLSPAMSGFTHIFIDTRQMSDAETADAREKIDRFARRVRNGGTQEFDAIVRESLDDASYTGGDFGYVINGDPNAVQVLGQQFVRNVLALQQNELSGVLESSIGFHIVKITDRRRPRLLDIDDPLLPGQKLTVRQQITQYIMNQKQQAAIQQALDEIISDLRSEAEIRIVENNISW